MLSQGLSESESPWAGTGLSTVLPPFRTKGPMRWQDFLKTSIMGLAALGAVSGGCGIDRLGSELLIWWGARLGSKKELEQEALT